MYDDLLNVFGDFPLDTWGSVILFIFACYFVCYVISTFFTVLSALFHKY